MIPEDYVPVFKKIGVTCVVRFNNKCYDRMVFERGGIKHVDLFYEDGGNPTEDILQAFLRLCETQQGAIAVHCKAGLGRTGTNIVAYMVKHLGFSVREAVAWHRVCRPGAIVGPQQQYLCSIEDKLKAEGKTYSERKSLEKKRCGRGATLQSSSGGQALSTSMVTPTLSSRPTSRQGALPRELGSTPHASSQRGGSEREKKSKSGSSSSRGGRGAAPSAAAAAQASEKLKSLSISGNGSGG